MEILAHRGLWIQPSEKNTLKAIEKAFENGFGIETDLRDYCGKLVISHDVASESSVSAEEMFRIYQAYGCRGQLALNVKADGIQRMVEELLHQYAVTNYFLFDMSIPELVVNESRGLLYYTRHSDIEKECVMYDKAKGVWIDYFYNDDWLTEDIIVNHLSKGKKVCLVSPELHGKQYSQLWKMLKETKLYKNNLLALCSDIPQKVKEYFYE